MRDATRSDRHRTLNPELKRQPKRTHHNQRLAKQRNRVEKHVQHTVPTSGHAPRDGARGTLGRSLRS